MFEARGSLAKTLLQLVITLLAIPYAFPLVVMVQGSLSGQGWGNYRAVLSRPELPMFFRNSLLIAVVTVLLVLLCTMCAAFAFSKLYVFGKEVIFWLLVACLTSFTWETLTVLTLAYLASLPLSWRAYRRHRRRDEVAAVSGDIRSTGAPAP